MPLLMRAWMRLLKNCTRNVGSSCHLAKVAAVADFAVAAFFFCYIWVGFAQGVAKSARRRFRK